MSWCFDRTGDQVVRTGWCFERTGDQVVQMDANFFLNSLQVVVNGILLKSGKLLEYVFSCTVTYVTRYLRDITQS